MSASHPHMWAPMIIRERMDSHLPNGTGTIAYAHRKKVKFDCDFTSCTKKSIQDLSVIGKTTKNNL